MAHRENSGRHVRFTVRRLTAAEWHDYCANRVWKSLSTNRCWF